MFSSKYCPIAEPESEKQNVWYIFLSFFHVNSNRFESILIDYELQSSRCAANVSAVAALNVFI